MIDTVGAQSAWNGELLLEIRGNRLSVNGGAFGCKAWNGGGHFVLMREGRYREDEPHSKSRAEP